jgi:hypothetical protein
MRTIQGVLYKVGTGEPIALPLGHLMVLGVTELSGKTSFIEAAIMAANYRGLTFRTKRGEIGFEGATKIPIYFEDKGLTHWHNLEGLMSATFNERIEREPGIRYAIQTVTKRPTQATNLEEILERTGMKQQEFKTGTFKEEVFGKLVNYLEEILPQLRKIPYTDRLELGDSGLYVMDLVGLSDEMQNLIIASVMRKIYSDISNVIVVLPEVAKFIPEETGSPVKWMFNRLLSEGRAVGDYVWLDGQNLRSIDKKPLRNIDTRLFGRQPDGYEIKEMMKMLPGEKLRPEEIMHLKVGHFYAKLRDDVVLVYAKPYWLPENIALKVAGGELDPAGDQVQQFKKAAKAKKEEFTADLVSYSVEKEEEDWSDVVDEVERVRRMMLVA